MVKSCLTVYVITISSVILLGTSNATTNPVQALATGQQDYQRDTNINFHSHASMNIADKNFTGAHYRSSEKPKTLQTSHVPSDDPKGHFNATRPYFALFDPVANVTIKVELSRQNGPPNISHRDFNDLLAQSLRGGNSEPDSGKTPHPSHRPGDSRGKIKNFIEWDTMRDSEKEVRIHYNGITAKETIVKTGADEDTGKRQGLKLRQLTDGTHFIQLIYNFDNEIQDCEYITQKTVIEKFLRTFRKDVENAKSIYEQAEDVAEEEPLEGRPEEEDDYWENDEGKIEKYSEDNEAEQYEGEDEFGQEYRNVTFQIIQRDTDLPGELAEWMNYPKLKHRCRENHRILKQLAFNRRHGDEVAKKLAEEHIERVKRSLDFSLIFPGTKWCGKSHIAEKYTALGGFSKTDKCCRTHDHCHPLITAFEEKYGFYNFRPFTVSHCRCDMRRKRDIMDVLLVPGTKWCGKGRRATKYTSLGGFSRTDKCCRVHDTMCPHWIGSLEEKYGLFNWRINTLMHCRCDKSDSLCVAKADCRRQPVFCSQESDRRTFRCRSEHLIAYAEGSIRLQFRQNETHICRKCKIWFRACLKMAKTGTANFVGKLFFNVVQTKCFVLKPREVCLEYSWWGKCKKMGYRKKAYLKDNLSY